MGVPWSSGEMPNIATLRAGYRVRIGATTYPTHWHSRGMPYIDDNGVQTLRMTYAVFRPTMAAGTATPTTPQFTPIVVAADNTGTSAASFATWASGLNITVAYHDWLADVNVSEDVGALARAGLNANTEALERNAGRDYYRIQDEGGQRTITYSAWIGPGRRHEPIRTLGHNDSGDSSTPTNPPIVRDGLLQVLVTIKIFDQDAHATVAIALMNGASYPYPSAPMDGGARTAGQPDRPTHLNPAATNPYTAATEQLESSLQRHIEDLTVTIAHGSTTVYSRPWYVSNHSTGAGPFGTLISDGNELSIPLEGLADRQGWGFRLTVSATSEADAIAKARRPYTFLATPTYQTWLNTTWERTFVGGEVDGDTCTMRGWWTFSLPDDIPASTFTLWRTRNNTAADVGFMNQTRSSPWHNIVGGYDDNITAWERGGKHYIAGNLHEGEAMLAGCHEFIYKMGAGSLRQNTAKIVHLEHAALHSLDTIRATSGGDRRNCYFEGTHIGVSGRGYTYQSFGRHQAAADGGTVTGSNFGGTVCPVDNPDPATTGTNDGPDWAPHRGGTHIGARSLYQYDLLTDDKMSRFLLTKLGHYVPLMTPCRGPFFGSSPAGQSARGELRPVWLGEMSVLRSDDSTYRDRILGHMVHRALEWRRTAAPSAWPNPGTAQNHDRNQYRGKPCGVPPFDQDNAPQLMQWWLIGQVDQFAMLLAMMAPTAADAASIAFSTAVMSKACVDFGWWIDETRIDAAAHRAFDSCWISHRTSFGAELHGFVCPKHSVPNRDAQTVDVVRMLNLHQDVGISNAAQTSQQYPALDVSMVFARNRNAAGHTDRVTFIKAAMRAFYPQLANGEDFSDSPQQHLGFLCGEMYEPGTTTPPPAPRFTASTVLGTIPLAVTFDASGSTYQGAEASLIGRWYAHYSGPTSVVSATRTGASALSWSNTYNGAGQYTPALELEQADGQSRLFIFSPPIDARANAIFPPDPIFSVDKTAVEAGAVVNFTYIERGGRALTYLWEYKLSTEPTTWTEFGNGARDAKWLAPGVEGDYDFKVTATNETGSDSHTELALVSVDVIDPPTARVAEVSGGTIPLSVVFDGSTSSFEGSAADVRWRWSADYNGGITWDQDITGPTGATFAHVYSAIGRYHYALLLTQAGGLESLYVYGPGLNVTGVPVFGPPSPEFSISATFLSLGETAQITYIERANGGLQATSWIWESSINGGIDWAQFSTIRDPLFIATEAGTFTVRVTASNQYEQPATKTYDDLVTVEGETPIDPPPEAFFTVDPTSGPYPLTVSFDAGDSVFHGDDQQDEYRWYRDASRSTPDAIQFGDDGEFWSFEYTLPGNYHPKLVVVQEDGQQATYVLKDAIIVTTDPATDPPEGTILADQTEVEPGFLVTLTWEDAGTLATSHEWFYRLHDDPETDWISFSLLNPATWEAPSVSGSYDFKCNATNENGTTPVEEEELISVSSGNEPTVSFTLTRYVFDRFYNDYPTPAIEVAEVTTTGADSYRWQLGSYESAEEMPTDMTAPGPGTWDVRLTVYNAFGEATAVKRVTIATGSEATGIVGNEAATGVYTIPTPEEE